MNLATFPFEKLRRTPDIEAPNLFAADASDRLLLDLATPAIAEASPGSVVVVGDRYGALTLGAAALGVRQIRVQQYSYTSELALATNWERLGAELGLPADSYDTAISMRRCLTGRKSSSCSFQRTCGSWNTGPTWCPTTQTRRYRYLPGGE